MPPAWAKGSSARRAEDKASSGTVEAVGVLEGPLARGVALARPAVLLGLLAYRFEALVAWPSRTLQEALPVVTAVQVLYAVLSLPPAGSQLYRAAAKRGRPGEKKKMMMERAGPKPVTTAILSLILAATVTPMVHLLFVLFGAPFLDHVSQTMLCSAHFALLGLFPIIYARGVDSQALVAVAGASAPLDETFGGLVGAFVGALLGAVPIPLDWDRDWQRWPVTIVVGMYTGSLLLSWASGSILYGKKVG